MNRDHGRILVTHVGSLVLDFDATVANAEGAAKSNIAEARAATPGADVAANVARAVERQVDVGVDVVNDGEQSKTSWSGYAMERLSGIEIRELPRDHALIRPMYARDRADFPEYFELGLGARGAQRLRMAAAAPAETVEVAFLTEPVAYVGHAAVEADIANLAAALEGVEVADAVISAIAPSTIEHWLINDCYDSQEEFLFAIADAMNVEYRAITDAGFCVQIDNPDLPDAWQLYPEMDLAEYRRYQELRVEANNHALRGVDPDRARMHVCWGSHHGPHQHDIGLADVIDLLFRVNVSGYLIEGANPRHEHEWEVFADVALPPGKVLVPGVVGHVSDTIEHPELVAQRLLRYARLVGRENVMAGTDCGLGPRVGHPELAWAKLRALAEGARIASEALWGSTART